MTNVVTRAAQFAQAAHQSIDQRRKYNNHPYIVHPAAVAATVSSVTDDPATIAAAWLHDVVEDTPVTIDEIKAEFGSDIAGLVADLTDVSRPSDGNREHRKSMDRLHTADADLRAKTVKLADMLDNLSNIAEIGPKFATIFIKENEQLLKVLMDGDSLLYRKVEQIIQECKAHCS